VLRAAASRGRPRDDGPDRDALRRAVEFAASFFARTLADPLAGAAARAAVEARGFTAETTRRFALGAAPVGFDNLRSALAVASISESAAIATGLLKPRPSGGAYDAFRQRLVFPIWDEVGRVTAFGGRILDPAAQAEEPKYLNSAESPFFHKSRTLYGLHLAKRSIMESRRAVVVEGYTDVIACHQAGITNVVGTLGTALTREHASLLSRLCDTVVLVFDGDEAGQRAADRGVEIFFAAPIDVRICVLEGAKDPDDLLRMDGGADRLRQAIDASIDALEFKLRRLQSGLPEAAGLSARQRHLDRFVDDLGRLGFSELEGTRKRFVLTALADLFRVPMMDVERAAARVSRPAGRTARGPSTASEPNSDSAAAPSDERPASRARRIAEADLLAVVLFAPEIAAEVVFDAGAPAPRSVLDSLEPSGFQDVLLRTIVEAVRFIAERGEEVAMPAILAQLADARCRAAAARLFADGRRRAESAPPGEVMLQCFAAMQACAERERFEEERRVGAAASPAPPGVPAGGEEARLLEAIRRRRDHGYVPGAIHEGART
jgi:DNA primase